MGKREQKQAKQAPKMNMSVVPAVARAWARKRPEKRPSATGPQSPAPNAPSKKQKTALTPQELKAQKATAVKAEAAFTKYLQLCKCSARQEEIPQCTSFQQYVSYQTQQAEFMFPLVHPKHLHQLCTALSTHKINTLVDAGSGSGFLAAVLQHYVGRSAAVFAFDNFKVFYEMHEKPKWFDVAEHDAEDVSYEVRGSASQFYTRCVPYEPVAKHAFS
jgi:protein-L-isoaspartate O-methyltransferase